MRAIKPPVLVPPMRSKYSQGNGGGLILLRLPTSSIISRNMSNDERPLTPPPSSDKRRGKVLNSVPTHKKSQIGGNFAPFLGATGREKWGCCDQSEGVLRVARTTHTHIYIDPRKYIKSYTANGNSVNAKGAKAELIKG